VATLLAFFTSSWAKYAIVLALIAGLVGYGWYRGDKHGSAKLDAYKVAQAKVAAKIVVKQAEVTTQVVTEYIHDTRIIHEKAATIIKIVPVYVTKYDDSRCTINNGFVQLWNGTNSGSVPPTPGPTNDSPSAVKLSDVAAEHAKEVEQYNETAERLKALQEWVLAQRKVSS
jgi:hypothetical protein